MGAYFIGYYNQERLPINNYLILRDAGAALKTTSSGGKKNSTTTKAELIKLSKIFRKLRLLEGGIFTLRIWLQLSAAEKPGFLPNNLTSCVFNSPLFPSGPPRLACTFSGLSTYSQSLCSMSFYHIGVKEDLCSVNYKLQNSCNLNW